MSEYGSLSDENKLARLMHLSERMGTVLENLLDAIQHQFDKFYYVADSIVKPEFQILNAHGTNVDALAAIFGLFRVFGEDDLQLSTRVAAYVTQFNVVTKESIQNLMEGFTGRKPLIVEEFVTRIYDSGDSVIESEAGRFAILFEIPYSTMSETLRVDSTGYWVEPTNIIDTDVVTGDLVVGGINDTVTIILLDTVTGVFPSTGGIIKIDDEYIEYQEYGSMQFTGCRRGMYDSVAASHVAAVPVDLVQAIAWLAGTNDVISDTYTSDKIYLINTPHSVDTLVNVRYNIENEMSTSDIVDLIDSMKIMGYEYAAAGVQVDISMGKLLTGYDSVYQDEIDMYESDILLFGFGHSETHTLPTPTGVFFINQGWGQAIWGAHRWGDSPASGSGSNYVEIWVWVV